MSAIAEPTVTPAAAPAAAAPVVPSKGPTLPSGVTLNKNYDAAEFFEKHKAANTPAAAAPAAEPKPADTAPAQPDPAAPAVAAAPEKKADIGAQLTEQFLPEAAKPKAEPKPADSAAAAASENPEDKVQLGKEYSAPAHESFKTIKGISKELRNQLTSRDRELQETRAQLEQVRKNGVALTDSPEFQALKAEHEAMSKRLMVLDLESHPNFQKEFVAPKNAAEQEAKNILAAAGVTDVNLDAILAKDGIEFRKAVNDVSGKLKSPLDVTDFATAIRTAQSLRQKALAAVSKAGEINQTLKAQTFNGYKTAFDETYQETLGSIKVAELTVPPGTAPEVVAEAEAFNAAVRGLRTESERIALGQSTPKDIARASIKAAAYEFQVKHVMPLVLKTVKAREARIAELEAKLSGIAARNPNAQMRGNAGDSGGVDPSKMNHKEAAEYFASRGSGT